MNYGYYNNIIMQYQKIANFLDNASNLPFKFSTENWVEINYESRGGYTTGSDTKFKTTMLSSSLCDYADAYILVKGTITIAGAENDAAEDKQMREIKMQYLKIVHHLLNP